MKSSFLLFLLLGALLSTQVLGQTKTKTTTAPVASQASEAQKSSFDKFYERLGIVYFGAVTSPTLEDFNGNHAAVSPEWSGKCKNCDTYAFNIWNQVNFAYNFGAKMKFNVIPRFTVFFDTPSSQAAGERGFVLLEDALVGFSGVIFSSPDKKFNWWIRPGIRLPTSHNSRHYNQADDPKTRTPGVGNLSYQLEALNSFTYDFNPSFQLGLAYQDRLWVFENRFNDTRRRMYIAPNFTVTLNDTTKIIGYYETILENNKRRESINGLKPTYRNMWQNAYVGVGKDITPKLNVYPYLSAFVNDVPFSTKSFFLGAWITYIIK